MKRPLIIAGIFVFAVFIANAQNQQTQKTQQTQQVQQQTQQTQQKVDDPNAPKIEFESLVHDYGTIMKGADGTCEFKFKNTGKEPLILSNVRSSCGCTVPKWPREPILPGQSNIIQVKYATTRVGAINKSITVESNASNSPVVISIKGTVLAPPEEQIPEKVINNEGTPLAR